MMKTTLTIFVISAAGVGSQQVDKNQRNALTRRFGQHRFLFDPVQHPTTMFSLPRTEVIVCADSLDNICTAPTSCNANGSAKFDPGNNLNVVTAEQRNGLWTIVGGYTISFPTQCTVTCLGNCTCEHCTRVILNDSISNHLLLLNR
jgi:hypothetical protein